MCYARVQDSWKGSGAGTKQGTAVLPPHFSSSTVLSGTRSDICASLFTGCKLPAACCCIACSLR